MKILYLLHIDWNWIFQRPQILAKMLENEYDITIVNKNVLFRKKIANKNIRPKKMINVLQFPKEYKIVFILMINKLLYKWSIKNWNGYDVIWVCYPLLFEFIPKNFRGKIIYDCMDNHVEMAPQFLKNKVRQLEQNLIKRADLIFVSSNNLKNTIPNMQDSILIRNGFLSQDICSIKESLLKERYRIGYFGTISTWFDFSILKNGDRNIDYHIIGSTENGIENELNCLTDNIHLEGVVPHEKLYFTIKDYDALIMPFIVNNTILSVDPVKLYEYICFGKCIISVWYPEIDRFKDFVYFYSNQEDFNEIIKKLKKLGFPAKYTKKQQEEFLKVNSWEYRFSLIKKQIENI